tara:strand:+ start:193 stop:354 length:162 start_codon:yes stop_codon:yes gene_type:complete
MDSSEPRDIITLYKFFGKAEIIKTYKLKVGYTFAEQGQSIKVKVKILLHAGDF